MSTKHIPDWLVCLAVQECSDAGYRQWPYNLLAEWSGQHPNVCYRAMERAFRRGHLNYGVSLRTAWLTNKGQALLAEP